MGRFIRLSRSQDEGLGAKAATRAVKRFTNVPFRLRDPF